MPFGLKLNIKLFYFFNILFMPLSWIILAGVGDTALKPIHLALIPLLFALIFKEYRDAFSLFISKQKVFVSLFLILMVLNFVSIPFNSVISNNAYSYIYKNVIYLFVYLLYGGSMLLFFNLKGNIKFITISNISAIIFFLAIAVITFKGSFIGDLVSFFIKGDMDGIKKDVYKSLFNNGNSSSDADLQSNLLNQLTGSFIIFYFTSLYAFKNINSIIYKALNVIVMLISFALIIANLSRSNIIAWVFGCLIYFICEIAFNRNYKKLFGSFFIFLCGAFLLITFWTVISTKLDASSQMLQDRFGEQIEDNARWATDAEAIQVFTSNFLSFIIGKGSGAKLSDGLAVHNFVLGSAYQAGVLGLILSIVLYLSIPFQIYKSLPVLSKYRFTFPIPALTCVPLIRMMESGNAGTLTIQEWFCLAFFLSFFYVKEKELKESRTNEYLPEIGVTKSLELSF